MVTIKESHHLRNAYVCNLDIPVEIVALAQTAKDAQPLYFPLKFGAFGYNSSLCGPVRLGYVRVE